MSFTAPDNQPVFLDTNVLVYTIDSNDPLKQSRARETLRTLAHQGSPIISTQVLMEFYNVAANKLTIDKVDARRFVEDFSRMHVVAVDVPLIKRAIDTSILAQLSFWDALIVSAAEQAGCSVLLSEDLNAGQTINGVKIVNPFA